MSTINKIHSNPETDKIMPKKSYDYIQKIIIIGDSVVGKSAIMVRKCDGEFNDTMISTIGVDFRHITIEADGIIYKLQIWDTAGQERFRTITAAYYRGTDAVIIVYDVTHKDSFTRVKFWLDECTKYCKKDITIILVGNKIDKPGREVTTKEGENCAKLFNCPFIEVSAKNNIRIDDLFDIIVKNINHNMTKSTPIINPDIVLPPHKEKSCCS